MRAKNTGITSEVPFWEKPADFAEKGNSDLNARISDAASLLEIEISTHAHPHHTRTHTHTHTHTYTHT